MESGSYNKDLTEAKAEKAEKQETFKKEFYHVCFRVLVLLGEASDKTVEAVEELRKFVEAH